MIAGILVNTLVKGGVYALLAIGFSLIFGVARMLNLAHTAFYMLAAYALYTFAYLLGLDPVLSIVLALVVAFLMSVGTYSLFVFFRLPSIVSIILSAVIALLLIWFGTGFILGMGGDVSLTKAIILSVIFSILNSSAAEQLSTTNCPRRLNTYYLDSIPSKLPPPHPVYSLASTHCQSQTIEINRQRPNRPTFTP